MNMFSDRGSAAYATAAASVAIVVTVGLLSSCSVERASSPVSGSGSSSTTAAALHAQGSMLLGRSVGS